MIREPFFRYLARSSRSWGTELTISLTAPLFRSPAKEVAAPVVSLVDRHVGVGESRYNCGFTCDCSKPCERGRWEPIRGKLENFDPRGVAVALAREQRRHHDAQ